MQNSRFRNAKAQLLLFKRIIFTKPRLFSESSLNKKGEKQFTDILPLKQRTTMLSLIFLKISAKVMQHKKKNSIFV